MQCFTQKNANLGDGRGEINESSNCSWDSARLFVTVAFLGLRNIKMQKLGYVHKMFNNARTDDDCDRYKWD